ncbi:hypothetical protein ACFO6R_06490 [Eubacterium multiforme]|uniref:Uncharacterized protein n=1 Tax=Eubacterium multiforme TaxID=83339 RepID=A0ABT9USE9_9FIRM|nr:hypothetical protein [Eubacterium multiforme]MDQ0149242.1 hypothetical protein [Eubacterium multiforme]
MDESKNEKLSKKILNKKNKIVYAVISSIIIIALAFSINYKYQKNKILKFDSNFQASYATYARGLLNILKNLNNYESQLEAKQLIIKGIDIAKSNEDNVPKVLKENYENYVYSLEQYSINLDDTGEINSYFLLIMSKLKDTEKKYNISKKDLESNMEEKLNEYGIS